MKISFSKKRKYENIKTKVLPIYNACLLWNFGLRFFFSENTFQYITFTKGSTVCRKTQLARTTARSNTKKLSKNQQTIATTLKPLSIEQQKPRRKVSRCCNKRQDSFLRESMKIFLKSITNNACLLWNLAGH